MYKVNLTMTEPEDIEALSDDELISHFQDALGWRAELEDLENTASYLVYQAREEMEKRNLQG